MTWQRVQANCLRMRSATELRRRKLDSARPMCPTPLRFWRIPSARIESRPWCPRRQSERPGPARPRRTAAWPRNRNRQEEARWRPLPRKCLKPAVCSPLRGSGRAPGLGVWRHWSTLVLAGSHIAGIRPGYAIADVAFQLSPSLPRANASRCRASADSRSLARPHRGGHHGCTLACGDAACWRVRVLAFCGGFVVAPTAARSVKAKTCLRSGLADPPRESPPPSSRCLRLLRV